VGESEVGQSAEVEGCCSGVEPGVVVDGAAVVESAVAVLDEPGDGAFDGGSSAASVSLPVGVGGGLAAGGRLQGACTVSGVNLIKGTPDE
jgi:hypothetical protein